MDSSPSFCGLKKTLSKTLKNNQNKATVPVRFHQEISLRSFKKGFVLL
jgi:CHASE1-domain containing sensor protein